MDENRLTVCLSESVNRCTEHFLERISKEDITFKAKNLIKTYFLQNVDKLEKNILKALRENPEFLTQTNKENVETSFISNKFLKSRDIENKIKEVEKKMQQLEQSRLNYKNGRVNKSEKVEETPKRNHNDIHLTIRSEYTAFKKRRTL
eukprot:maker-scaffold_2-snap-gene-18.5-mRNA-1 protein AED:0.00 eAED:0.00 QI:128/1/1/1/1/1/2/1411/147